MANTVKEEVPNPYNAKKDWHTDDGKAFESSNNVYFEAPQNRLFDSNDITEVGQEGSVNTEELESKKNAPYKKPDYKKRYDDLKKHYDSKLNEFKSREQELIVEATQNRTDYKAPKSPEELEEFKNNYPDVYEVVETVAHMQSESKAKVLEERLSKLQERETQLIRQDAEKTLMDRHPDFEDIRNSDDFHGWAKEQHSSIQAWVYDNNDDASLASRALDLFKKDFGIEATTKSSSKKPTRQSAADMVSTKTTSVEPNQQKVWSLKEIEAMSVAEFDKFETEISDAMQNGLISQ
jgi:hypothetical protein|tara:strand:- start:640 stop:1518 length:879 start_codon:yes stop_codon:yes gene_type:complete